MKNTITKFVRANEDDDVIQPTQGQELQNLSNFATPPPGSSAGNRPRQATVLSPEVEMLQNMLTGDDEVSQVIHRSLHEQISTEINYYQSLKFNQEEKLQMNVLKWWKDNKNSFPYLYQAAKGLLHIPATSVSSERIFSEAGYIARTCISRILPVNLDRHLFIKKNLRYVPIDVTGSDK